MKPIAKTAKTLSLAVALAIGALSAGPTLAQHHRHHGPRISLGFSFGAPIEYYYYYAPSPYYYAPPPYYYHPRQVVVVPADPPPVYVERESAPAAAPVAEGSWYYCTDSRTYYPYVRDCATGWQRVAPRPN